ncbi:hypothetical protein ACKWTF_004062 [Chironomus riparius]
MDNSKEKPEVNRDGESSEENSHDSPENSQNSHASSKKSEGSHNLNNISIDDIDEDIKERIKGDRIGDTLYSERFILNTLMELKELNDGKLETELENKLEILWDTTIEKDVVELLLNYGLLDIAGVIIESTEDDRLIEILLGIIANMACHKETREQLCNSTDVMGVILNQLTSNDPLVLHQLMRLLHSAILFENSGDETVWFNNHFKKCEDFVEKFSFILANSTSNTLLMSSFEALNSVCAKFAMIECQTDSEKDASFPQLFVKKCLVEAMIEAFKQVIGMTVGSDSTDIIPTQNQQKFMNLFLELNMIISQYESLSMDAYSDYLPEFQNCLGRILIPLTHKMYLLPFNSNNQGILENINDITQALQDPFDEKIFSQMVIIWDLIDWEDKDDSTVIDIDDLSMTILEFLTRTGFNSNQEQFTASLKNLKLDLTMKLFERVNDNEDPEDEIKSVIEKMKYSIKEIWEVDLNKQ